MTCRDDLLCAYDLTALDDEGNPTRAGACYHLDGLACLDGRCVQLPGEGEACAPDDEESSISCQEGLACRAGRCVPAAVLGEGEACAYYTSEWCARDLTCDNGGMGSFSEGVCVAQSGHGEPCFDYGGPEESCKDWLACVDGVCSLRLCNGGPVIFGF